jgi:hypothetical protein
MVTSAHKSPISAATLPLVTAHKIAVVAHVARVSDRG